MDENIEKKSIGSINANTQIVFTLKSFIGTIASILGIFIGFYSLVIVPKFNEHKEEVRLEKEANEKKFNDLNIHLMEITNGIGTISGNIEGINNRLIDMNSRRNSEGGSFGQN